MKTIEKLRTELQTREKKEYGKKLDVVHEHIKSVYSGEYTLTHSSGDTYGFKALLKNGTRINALIQVEDEPYLFAISFGKSVSYRDEESKIMKLLNSYAIKETT